MIVQADVLISSVLHAESTRHRPDLYEPEPFIQMPGVDVVFHNGIELQDIKAKPSGCARQSRTSFSPIC